MRSQFASRALGMALLVIGCANAAPASDESELLELSVEQLLNTEVMTASRRAQAAGLVPAPLYVITQADIRRSGASSIPELLRAVPGISVAQLDANKWAVGGRGLARRFSNKLLILVDGRPVYSPLFSGVFWDVQDTDLDSIERIEVVSGPGATLWGANAVSGVINIITRSAHESRARAVTARIDGEGGNSLQAHLAGELADATSGRLFVKRTELSGNENLLGTVADESDYLRFGGRLDGELDSGSWVVTAEAYEGRSGSLASLVRLDPFGVELRNARDEVEGAFVNARWNTALRSGGDVSTGVFYEHSERSSYFFGESRDTVQVEAQHSLRSTQRNAFMWGGSYRHSTDRIDAQSPVVVFQPSDSVIVAGLFAQNELQLSPDRWTLITGAKVEYESLSESTHFEPNIRVRYRMSDSAMWWASVARAVGMPSRGERDAQFYGPFIPANSPFNPTPYAGTAVVSATGKIEAERADTAELGLRWHSDSSQWRIEPTLHYTRYNNLTRAIPGAPICMPSGTPLGVTGCPGPAFLLFPSMLDGQSGVSGYGAELATEWWPASRLRIVANYSFQRIDNPPGFGAAQFIAATPEHQAYVRSSINLPRGIAVDVGARYADRTGLQNIDSYVAVDTRLAWAPVESFELALSGKNLLDPEHLEYTSEIGDLVPTPIERSAALELRFRF
jgi:iron complex outermembrane recepter protein